MCKCGYCVLEEATIEGGNYSRKCPFVLHLGDGEQSRQAPQVFPCHATATSPEDLSLKQSVIPQEASLDHEDKNLLHQNTAIYGSLYSELEILREEVQEMREEVEKLKREKEDDEVRFREKVLMEEKEDIEKHSAYVNLLKERYRIKSEKFKDFRSKLQNKNGTNLKKSAIDNIDENNDENKAEIESRFKKLEEEFKQSKKDFEELLQKTLSKELKTLAEAFKSE